MVVGITDHDYTRPRTPPDADKVKASKLGASKTITPKPRGKENREMQVKKEALDKRKMPPMSSKAASRLAFRPRNQMDEYNVLYSFLIRGGCRDVFPALGLPVSCLPLYPSLLVSPPVCLTICPSLSLASIS